MIVLVLSVVASGYCDEHVGYSYAKFTGPVSGPSHPIEISDGHDHVVDYVSKPDYHFSYGVDDPHSDVKQSRSEHRDGDIVVGEYSVQQPDGKVRLVKYTADPKSGFNAQVYLDGQLQDDGREKSHHVPETVHTNHDVEEANYEDSSEY